MNKKIASILFGLVLALAMVLPVQAQKAGVQTLLGGGNSILPATTTNLFVATGSATNQFGAPQTWTMTSSNLTMTVAEFDNVGLSWHFTGFSSGATNATVVLRVYKSYDNAATWDVIPSYIYSITPGNADGTTPLGTNANLSCTGATHIGFEVENNVAVLETNVQLRVNLKSPKYGARQATQ
jgi:hypothetical protein